MHRATRSKLTLADLMILIGANAVSLACFILIDNNLYGGGRYFFGVFDWSLKTWISPLVLDKAEGAFAIACSLFGAWTLALPLIGFRKPWRERLRLLRGPGLMACLAAATGLGFCVGATLLAFALPGSMASSTCPSISGIPRRSSKVCLSWRVSGSHRRGRRNW